MTILDGAYLLLWIASAIVMGCAWEATAAWCRRRRITRTAFPRMYLAGRIVHRARRIKP